MISKTIGFFGVHYNDYRCNLHQSLLFILGIGLHPALPAVYQAIAVEGYAAIS
jgi:hypothetical protein